MCYQKHIFNTYFYLGICVLSSDLCELLSGVFGGQKSEFDYLKLELQEAEGCQRSSETQTLAL